MTIWQRLRPWLAAGAEAPRIFLLLTIVALFVGAAWVDSNVTLYAYIGFLAFFLVQLSLVVMIAILVIRQRRLFFRYSLTFTPLCFLGTCVWKSKALLHEAPLARFGDLAIYFYGAIFAAVIFQSIPPAFPPRAGRRPQTILER
jgi:hypothetical protein